MKRHSNVIDLGLYRLRKLAHAGRNSDLFETVAREQRLRNDATNHTRELMRRACARAAEKASQEHTRLSANPYHCECSRCRGDA